MVVLLSIMKLALLLAIDKGCLFLEKNFVCVHLYCWDANIVSIKIGQSLTLSSKKDLCSTCAVSYFYILNGPVAYDTCCKKLKNL